MQNQVLNSSLDNYTTQRASLISEEISRTSLIVKVYLLYGHLITSSAF